MNEADQPVATSYCLQSSNQMNEKEGRMRDIDPPLPTALHCTGSIRSDALKDVLLHCPARQVSSRATLALSGEIYLKQWRPWTSLSYLCSSKRGNNRLLHGALIYTSIVVYNLWSNGTLGISSSGKLLQFECHNSKVDWNFVTSHFYYSFMSLFLFERGEERLTFIIGISTRPLLSLVKQSPLLHSTTTSSSTTNQWNK